jgi:hypothetical protein
MPQDIDFKDLSDRVLRTVNVEEFARTYFGEFRRQGDEVAVLCPCHEDRNPSYHINTKTGMSNCKSCGKDGAPKNVIELYMHFNGDDYSDKTKFGKATKEMAEDLGLIDTYRKKDDGERDRKRKLAAKNAEQQRKDKEAREKDKVDNRPPTPNGMKTLEERRGISDASIDKYKIGWDADNCDKKVYKWPSRVTIPVRDKDGIIRNVRRYSSKEKLKMLNLCVLKDWRIVSAGSADKNDGYRFGSPIRLFGIDELRDRPDERVWIFEGEWDKIRASELGLLAVSGTGGCGYWKNEWSEALEGRDVVVVYDTDGEIAEGENVKSDNLKGQGCAKLTVIPSVSQYAKSTKNIKLPFNDGEQGKDISEWLDCSHTLDELEELAVNAEVIKRTGKAETRGRKKDNDPSDHVEIDFTVERMVIYRTSPRIYEMHVEDCVLQLGTSDLISPAKFKLRFVDTIERVPKMPGRKAEKRWDDWVNEWMESAERVEMPEEASMEGALKEAVEDAIMSMPIGIKLNDLDRGKILEKDGLGLFKLQPLMKTVKETYAEASQPNVCKLVRNMGCRPTKRKVGVLELRLWVLDDSLLQSILCVGDVVNLDGIDDEYGAN